MDLVDALVASVSASEAELLLDWMQRETGFFGERLFVGWAKLRGAASRERILSMLQSRERWPAYFAVEAAGEVFAGSKDDALAWAIAEACDVFTGFGVKSACKALKAIGGEVALRELQRVVQRLDPALQRDYLPRDTDTDRLTQELVELQILSAPECQAALAKLSKPQPTLESILGAAHRHISFDVETSCLPCDHAELLERFAQQSAGKFAPQAISQVWQQVHDRDLQAHYELRFELGGSAYIGELRNFDDWYDVERLVLMIHRALEDAGLADRFVMIDRNDQAAEFFFVDPQRFEALVTEHKFAISADFDAPRRHGVEFEQQALAALREQGIELDDEEEDDEDEE